VTLDMQERIGRITLPLRRWLGRKLRHASGWQD
jgi:hypothetical protein